MTEELIAEYRIIEFQKRIKPYVSQIRVCDIKIAELSDIRQRVKQHYDNYGHFEIQRILSHIDNDIKEQRTDKELLEFEIVQVKEMVI